eukprot:15462513-Alexandrium_andersonii.AAC.1
MAWTHSPHLAGLLACAVHAEASVQSTPQAGGWARRRSTAGGTPGQHGASPRASVGAAQQLSLIHI